MGTALRPAAGDAARAIVAAVRRQPTLRMPLQDTLGHVLADDVRATIPLPPWTNAAMDGYAVRGADIAIASATTPARLAVVGEVPAGASPQRTVGPGEAIRIFTGAPVPDGADSVVRQEDTDQGEPMVSVLSARDAGANIRRAGADLAPDALALQGGTIVGAHQLALLAALGISHATVHRKPRVAILVTGNELATASESEEVLAGRRLADANGPGLSALVSESGGLPVSLGIAPDDPTAIRTALEAAGDADLLITAGGISVGAHDHLPAVMKALGATLLVERVRMRPGGPTTFGLLPDRRPWLGLPGNPVSAMVTFELFGRPAIRTMLGDRTPFRTVSRFALHAPIRREPAVDLYVRVEFLPSDNGGLARARLTGPQGSGMLTSVARADGLVIVPAGSGELAAGSVVEGWEW